MKDDLQSIINFNQVMDDIVLRGIMCLQDTIKTSYLIYQEEQSISKIYLVDTFPTFVNNFANDIKNMKAKDPYFNEQDNKDELFFKISQFLNQSDKIFENSIQGFLTINDFSKSLVVSVR